MIIIEVLLQITADDDLKIFNEENDLKLEILRALEKLEKIQTEKVMLTNHNFALINEYFCPTIAKICGKKNPYPKMDITEEEDVDSMSWDGTWSSD